MSMTDSAGEPANGLSPDAVVERSEDLTATTRHPLLRRLFEYWSGKAAGRMAPTRADIDPVDFSYAIGWTTLVDVLEGGGEFQARVFGGGMAMMAGQELTGRTSAAMQDPELRRAIVANLRWVVANRKPLRIYREQTTAQRRYRYETVILPLSSDGQTVDQLLMAATPPLSEAV